MRSAMRIWCSFQSVREKGVSKAGSSSCTPTGWCARPLRSSRRREASLSVGHFSRRIGSRVAMKLKTSRKTTPSRRKSGICRKRPNQASARNRAAMESGHSVFGAIFSENSTIFAKKRLAATRRARSGRCANAPFGRFLPVLSSPAVVINPFSRFWPRQTPFPERRNTLCLKTAG